jgi:hypothetical protein
MFSLSLTKHHATKMYWGSGRIAPRIIPLAVLSTDQEPPVTIG